MIFVWSRIGLNIHTDTHTRLYIYDDEPQEPNKMNPNKKVK